MKTRQFTPEERAESIANWYAFQRDHSERAEAERTSLATAIADAIREAMADDRETMGQGPRA